MGREKHFWAVHLDFSIIYVEMSRVLKTRLLQTAVYAMLESFASLELESKCLVLVVASSG